MLSKLFKHGMMRSLKKAILMLIHLYLTMEQDITLKLFGDQQQKLDVELSIMKKMAIRKL